MCAAFLRTCLIYRHSEKYDACRKRVENVKGMLPAELKAEWDNLRSEHEKLIAEEQEMQKKERVFY